MNDWMPLFGCFGIIALNLWAGTASVRYLVLTLLHQHIGTLWALLIGLVGGEVTIPAAVVVWLLKHAGVSF